MLVCAKLVKRTSVRRSPAIRALCRLYKVAKNQLLMEGKRERGFCDVSRSYGRSLLGNYLFRSPLPPKFGSLPTNTHFTALT